MLGEDHAGPIRHILKSLHLVANADHHFGEPDGETAPAPDNETVACPEGHERCEEETERAPDEGAQRQQQVKEEGSDGLHCRHGSC
ncbi:hypothetical protein D3C77_747920 [compost metagenome]